MLQKKSGFDVCNLMFIVKYGINADESVRQCCQYDLLQYKWFGWRKFAEYDIRKPDDNPALWRKWQASGAVGDNDHRQQERKRFPLP